VSAFERRLGRRIRADERRTLRGRGVLCAARDRNGRTPHGCWARRGEPAHRSLRQTETAKNDLRKIEDRWLRATTDKERATIARDAELLADRVQENLAGAPQDRKRTNLFKDEKQTFTPGTSYHQEVKREGAEDWDWFKRKASEYKAGAASILTLITVGGAIYLGTRFVAAMSKERSS
jgi:hypothetical protein